MTDGSDKHDDGFGAEFRRRMSPSSPAGRDNALYGRAWWFLGWASHFW